MLLDELYEYELTKYIPHRIPYGTETEHEECWKEQGDELIYCGSRYYSGRCEEEDDDDNWFDEEEAWSDYEEAPIDLPETYDFEDMDDFKEYLGLENEDTDLVLSMRFCDLLGLNSGQMKFLDADLLNMETFSLRRLMDDLQSETIRNSIPDPEQRIRYCVADVLYDAEKLIVSQQKAGNDIRAYICRIGYEHDPAKAGELYQLLKDYYHCRTSGLWMNREREERGEPVFDYVLTPKPSHIRDLHDKAARDYATLEARAMEQERQETNARIDAVKKLPSYRRYLYESREFRIIAPKDIDAIHEEGERLNHCVVSYIPAFASEESYLYFLRKAENPEEPYFTLEVKKKDGRYTLTQCYTKSDTIFKSEACRNFIRQWAHTKRLRIDCEI